MIKNWEQGWSQETDFDWWHFDWFCCPCLEHRAELPANRTGEAGNPQHSGVVILLWAVMDFDAMPTDTSVLGAHVTTTLDHHTSNDDCNDCGVGWIPGCTGALTRRKKVSSGHLVLRSSHGLRATELPWHP